MILATLDRFPTPDEYRRIPRDARCTVARRSSFVRVDTAAMPGDMGKFKQIKLTIQRSISRSDNRRKPFKPRSCQL